MEFILSNKPMLIGLHLGLAIIGIDLMLWLAGELYMSAEKRSRAFMIAVWATIAYFGAWLVGGYYYVKFYGPLVKPEIKASAAPWAHSVAMEVKEHVFLFIIPLALTVVLLTVINHDDFSKLKLAKPTFNLIALTVLLSFAIGGMGYIISAVARWGSI